MPNRTTPDTFKLHGRRNWRIPYGWRQNRNSPGGGLAEIEAQLFGPAKLGGRWQQRGCWFASAMAAYCFDEIVE